MKKELDIYYILEQKRSNKIEKEIYEYLSKIYCIKKFTQVTNLKEISNEKNLIKKGMKYFQQIWNTEKLKSTNELFFIYIGKGDIPKVYNKIDIILLTQNPMNGSNKLHYSILKSQNKIEKTMSNLFNSKELEYEIR